MQQIKRDWDFDEEPHAAELHYPSTRKRQRRRRHHVLARSLFRAGAVLSIVAVCGGIAFSMLTGKSEVAARFAAQVPDVDTVATLAGFGIEQVSISGHRYTTDAAIFEALALYDGKSIASFDIVSARRKLEAIPWIKTAALKRVYPGELRIRVEERRAFALWEDDNGRLFLIDREGRVLSRAERHLAPSLPLVIGTGAGERALRLHNVLAKHGAIAARLVSAEWVAGRRWRLRLRDQIRIELPADSAVAALGLLSREPVLREAVAQPQTLIDLRVSGRAAVRTQGGVAQPGPRPLTIEDLMRQAG